MSQNLTAHITLVLGGASSGKSNIAETLCLSQDIPRIYLATAQAYDDEMRSKVEQHKLDRGPNWCTIESPLEAAKMLDDAPAGHVILLDCLTMWLTNHLLADADLIAQTHTLLHALNACTSPVVLVSNEVGQGIVPENALARKFRIEQGQLNRKIAAQAGCVIGVMAGLPFALKGELPKVLL